jgi:hypothetical protein
MTQKATLVIWLLLFSASVLLAVMGCGAAVGSDILPDSASHLIDRSPTTLAIVIVFSAGLVTNGINTLYLLFQARLVNAGVTERQSRAQPRFSGRGILGMHIERLCKSAEHLSTESVSQTVSLNSIRNQLYRREWLVRSASGLLLTLGLIGTVLGLTNSLGGLSATVNVVAQDTLNSVSRGAERRALQSPAEKADTDSTEIAVGLNQALGGMASAFLTTLFGAVFGGVCLRILCSCTECFTEELVDRIELLTEASVLPRLRLSPEAMIQRREREFRKWVEQMENLAVREFEHFGELSVRIGQITANFEKMADALKRAEDQLAGSRATIEMLDGMNTYLKKWERFTSSRMAITGTVSFVFIAISGIIRIGLDIIL